MDTKKIKKKEFIKALINQIDSFENWEEFYTIAFSKMVEGDEKHGNWQKRFKQEQQLDIEIGEELFDIFNYMLMRKTLREKDL